MTQTIAIILTAALTASIVSNLVLYFLCHNAPVIEDEDES